MCRPIKIGNFSKSDFFSLQKMFKAYILILLVFACFILCGRVLSMEEAGLNPTGPAKKSFMDEDPLEELIQAEQSPENIEAILKASGYGEESFSPKTLVYLCIYRSQFSKLDALVDSLGAELTSTVAWYVRNIVISNYWLSDLDRIDRAVSVGCRSVADAFKAVIRQLAQSGDYTHTVKLLYILERESYTDIIIFFNYKDLRALMLKMTGDLLADAAGNGHYDIVRYMALRSPVASLFTPHIEAAVKAALSGGHDSVAAFLASVSEGTAGGERSLELPGSRDLLDREYTIRYYIELGRRLAAEPNAAWRTEFIMHGSLIMGERDAIAAMEAAKASCDAGKLAKIMMEGVRQIDGTWDSLLKKLTAKQAKNLSDFIVFHELTMIKELVSIVNGGCLQSQSVDPLLVGRSLFRAYLALKRRVYEGYNAVALLKRHVGGDAVKKLLKVMERIKDDDNYFPTCGECYMPLNSLRNMYLRKPYFVFMQVRSAGLSQARDAERIDANRAYRMGKEIRQCGMTAKARGKVVHLPMLFMDYTGGPGIVVDASLRNYF